MKRPAMACRFAAGFLGIALWHLATAAILEPFELVAYPGNAQTRDSAYGYQDIRIGPDSWYVAFHGTRLHSIAQVELGWLGRAAQLCRSIRKRHVVELRYVGEPVFQEESVVRNDKTAPPRATRVAGSVPIPIFIPSSPVVVARQETPSKMAAVRCIDDLNGIRPGKTGIPVSDALEAANKAIAESR